MKKLTLCFASAMLLMTLATTPVMAGTERISTVKPIESTEAQALVDRLHEIKAMDMSTLSPAEKKELRKEVRATKAQLRDGNYGGIYISAGAIIIILLLIIIL